MVPHTLGLAVLLCSLLIANAQAQRTMGLLHSDPRAYRGYTLFAPVLSNTAFLIDNDGRLVHRWDGSYMPGLAVYLLESGNLLRMCRVDPGTPEGGGRIEEVDWDGNVLWSLDDKASGYHFHHDVTPLPNGNFLVLANEIKTKNEAIAAGRNPQYFNTDIFTPDLIVELQPDGNGSAEIVWEWHFWDHMCTSLNGEWTANGRPVSKDIKDPGKIDINFLRNGQLDWLHCNAVDYNAALDQIAISGHNPCEIYVISHRTANYVDHAAGIEAARGPEGDFLYRWGNPAAYGRGLPSDKRLFGQHDIHWIRDSLPGAGHFLLYNNGLNRPAGNFSTVEEFDPPVQGDGSYLLESGNPYGPRLRSWVYRAPNPTDFYSQNISSAQRLPNGNTLICEGAKGHFFEVTADSTIVWRYVNPVNDSGAMMQGWLPVKNSVFKCRRYAADYPGLRGRDLTPGDPIERTAVAADAPERLPASVSLTAYPNPARSSAGIRFTLPRRQHVILSLHDALGREVLRIFDGSREAGSHDESIDTGQLAVGKYFIQLSTGSGIRSIPLSVRH